MDDKNYIILRTYSSVWKFEREIYSLEGFKLLFPIKPSEAMYFIAGLGFSFIVSSNLSIMTRIPGPVKYILFPYGLMKFLTKQKLDGKLPHKFFVDFIVYKLSPKKYERFKTINEISKPIRFISPIAYKVTLFINKTKDILVSKNKKTRAKGKRGR